MVNEDIKVRSSEDLSKIRKIIAEK